MKQYDILIIGGDAAGMSAASQARRISETLSIGVFEKGPHVSYAACGMPYYIAGDVPGPERPGRNRYSGIYRKKKDRDLHEYRGHGSGFQRQDGNSTFLPRTGPVHMESW